MEELISQAVSFLKDGKVILSPTDTIWGLACDATSEKAIARIQEIKKRDISKNFILQVSSLRMLEKYVKVSNFSNLSRGIYYRTSSGKGSLYRLSYRTG